MLITCLTRHMSIWLQGTPVIEMVARTEIQVSYSFLHPAKKNKTKKNKNKKECGETPQQERQLANGAI